MQEITCATFIECSLTIANFYQKLRKLFFEHYILAWIKLFH